jgi:uncharacterized protein DUF4332
MGSVSIERCMARLPKAKLPNFRLSKRGKPAEAPAPLSEASAPPVMGLKFVPLEFRPASGRPETRAPFPVEAPAPRPAPIEPAPSMAGAVPEAPGSVSGFSPAERAQPIEATEGIGEVYGAKLREAGVATLDDLSGRDADALARQTGIPQSLVTRWQAQGALQRIAGVGPQFSELLVRAGVDGVDALAAHDATGLVERVRTYQEGLDVAVVGVVVTHAMAEDWIRQAKAFAPLSTRSLDAMPVGAPLEAEPRTAPRPSPRNITFKLPILGRAKAPAVAGDHAATGPEPKAAKPSRFRLPGSRGSEPPAAAVAPATEQAPPPALEAAAPKLKMKLSFGRKNEPPGEPSTAPSDAPINPKGKFKLTFGRKKDAPAEVSSHSVGASPAAAPAQPTTKRRFAMGRAKPAEGPPAAPSAQPVLPEIAQVAPTVTPAPLAIEPTMPAPAAAVSEPAPAMPRAAWTAPASLATPARPQLTPVEYESIQAHVDRVLTARAAAQPGLADRVEQPLRARAPKRKGSKAGAARTPK